MRVIDSHAHIWKIDAPWLEWLRQSTVPGYGAVKRDVGPDDYFAATEGTPVRQVVLVQAGFEPAETAALLDVADGDDRIAGVVGWVSLASPTATRRDLESLAPRRKLVGIRSMDGWPPDGNPLQSGAGYESAQLLADEDLALDVVFGPPEELRFVTALAERVPELRIVVDHLGIPPGADADKSFWERWTREIAALASSPNVSVKYSAWTTRLPAVRADVVAPFIGHVLREFDPSRVMYGGNWPISIAASDYPTMYEASAEALGPLGDAEREAIFSGTVTAVYGLRENAG